MSQNKEREKKLIMLQISINNNNNNDDDMNTKKNYKARAKKQKRIMFLYMLNGLAWRKVKYMGHFFLLLFLLLSFLHTNPTHYILQKRNKYTELGKQHTRKKV